MSVVLPAPRKPVTIVQGTRASEEVIRHPPSIDFLKIQRRYTRDQAALERYGPPAPRHQTIGRAGEETRTFDERTGAGDIETAEHIGPGTVATNGGAGPARAIGEAAYLPN